jgi:uncharacterized membrane protein
VIKALLLIVLAVIVLIVILVWLSRRETKSQKSLRLQRERREALALEQERLAFEERQQEAYERLARPRNPFEGGSPH